MFKSSLLLSTLSLLAVNAFKIAQHPRGKNERLIIWSEGSDADQMQSTSISLSAGHIEVQPADAKDDEFWGMALKGDFEEPVWAQMSDNNVNLDEAKDDQAMEDYLNQLEDTTKVKIYGAKSESYDDSFDLENFEYYQDFMEYGKSLFDARYGARLRAMYMDGFKQGLLQRLREGKNDGEMTNAFNGEEIEYGDDMEEWYDYDYDYDWDWDSADEDDEGFAYDEEVLEELEDQEAEVEELEELEELEDIDDDVDVAEEEEVEVDEVEEEEEAEDEVQEEEQP